MPYWELETVATQRTEGYWLDQAKKTCQPAKSAKNSSRSLFGNKSNSYQLKNMRYFLHLAYDGTEYHGWQMQPGVRTVQQELDRCLRQVLRQPVYCLGSGRTDSGVHASHQVAHFDADLPEGLDLPTLLYRLNHFEAA